MGGPQSYYGPFADWLAAEGCVTLILDDRGIGAPRLETSLWRPVLLPELGFP
jgi:predicted alpha/beta hydrolase